MSFAEIKEFNEKLTVFVDEKPITPMFMLMRNYENEGYIKGLYNSGIRLFYVYAETNWLRKDGFEKFINSVSKIIKNAPNAYIMVRLVLHPPKKWVVDNPDEVVRYDDGSIRPCRLAWGTGFEDYSGHYSLLSKKWRHDALNALDDFCEKVDKSFYSDRIIGYFLCAGGTCEWYYNTPIIDSENNLTADISPAFMEFYKEYLRNKYKTDKALRQAWNDRDASLDSPQIPTCAKRTVVEKARKLMLSAKNSRSYYDYFDFDCKTKKDDYSIGMFSDVSKNMCLTDFYDAWHEGVADSLIHFGQHIKQKYKGKLTGAFFAYCGCTDFYSAPTSSSAMKVIRSGAIDMLSSPGTYVNRQRGGCLTQRTMSDSMKLNKVLFVSEEDCRTHLAPKLWRIWNRVYTEKDSLAVLKRDFARNICEGSSSWWFDMSREGLGFYEDEAFYKLFTAQQRIAELSYKYGRGKKNDIAVICSPKSFHCVSEYITSLMVDYYRNAELNYVGCSMDYYFLDDMEEEKMPGYKLYLMLNLFNLSDEDREIIRMKAAQNNAMIIWLHAPGFIDTEGKEKISIKNIEKTVGMQIHRCDELCVPSFRLDAPLHEAVKGGNIDRDYGHIDGKYISNYSFYDEVGPHIEDSYFYINDPSVSCLGKYVLGGKTALGFKKNDDGITDVYCASRILSHDLLTSLAEYADCHIFNSEGDVIFSGNGFLTLHTTFSGKHTIHFKEKCSPFEVYEKKYYGHSIDKLDIELGMGETLMFSINDEISKEISK